MKYKLVTLLAAAFMMVFTPMLSLIIHKEATTQKTELRELVSGYFEEKTDFSPTENSEKNEILQDDFPVISSLSFDEHFKILDEDSGKIITVTATEYIRGAIAAEMPFTFHIQALAAQGVAAYTNAVRSQINERSSPTPSLKGADISARPDSLKGWTDEKTVKEWYGIYAEVAWEKICEAAEIAAEYILIYDEEPIVAAYCSMSSGVTESSENVWGEALYYLSPVESLGDELAPDFLSEETFTPEEVQNILSAAEATFDFSLPHNQWFQQKEISESGYVIKQTVCGVEIDGQEMRSLFSLRSACFDVTFNGSEFKFTVKGYGHGVGLSQYGADYMARQGCNFIEILQHYYKNALVAKIKR